MGKQMVRVAMNTSNFLGQTSLCKSSIAQSRMCCIALFSASGNPSVQKVPIPQASALRLKSIFQKCAACIHRMQNTRGLGTAQQAFWIWFLEIGFKNCKLVPACTACWYNVIDETKIVSSRTVIWLCRFPKHSNIEVLTGAESGKTACLVSIQELLTA